MAELRTMEHPTFLDVARGVYKSLLNCIEGIQRQDTIIIDVIQSIQCVVRAIRPRQLR